MSCLVVSSEPDHRRLAALLEVDDLPALILHREFTVAYLGDFWVEEVFHLAIVHLSHDLAVGREVGRHRQGDALLREDLDLSCNGCQSLSGINLIDC